MRLAAKRRRTIISMLGCSKGRKRVKRYHGPSCYIILLCLLKCVHMYNRRYAKREKILQRHPCEGNWEGERERGRAEGFRGKLSAPAIPSHTSTRSRSKQQQQQPRLTHTRTRDEMTRSTGVGAALQVSDASVSGHQTRSG